ncbi:MAG: c-type cytochrome [Thiohalorhabdus sp.]|uniref:c-type cytochrome n=1 Tax=Thiohalorhabdus sp. TaxID=3094134 RepID=UPI00397EED79
MRTMIWAAAMASALVVSPALAAEDQDKGDAEAGKELVMQGKPDEDVQPCQACHGEDGAGQAASNFPRLAGQDVKYMVKQMEDFASEDRANYPTMKGIAEGLSEEEKWDVARYYHEQEVDTEEADADSSVIETGERIAERGVPEEDVPACTSCHGPEGKGVPPVFPQIAGQHAGYIQKQLQDWEGGSRENDPADMMTEIAPKLSEEEMEAVGAYFNNVDAE